VFNLGLYYIPEVEVGESLTPSSGQTAELGEVLSTSRDSPVR